MPRASVVKSSQDASGAIQAALDAEGFEPAPSAKKGGKAASKAYESKNLQAARSGELSRKMEQVFARDTKLDPGVKETGNVQEVNRYRAQSVKQSETQEVKKLAAQLKGTVTVTKTGAVQIRRTKETPDGKRPGTVAKTVRPGFRSGGKFVSPGVEVVDEKAFKDAADSRVEGYGASLFGRNNVTESRKQAMLAALQRDRERRGWKGVPRLD